MSGWIKRTSLGWIAKWSFSRAPKPLRDAVDQIDTQWDKMDGKVPDKQFPTMPQSEVNKEFKEKEDRVRKFHGNPKNR